MGLPPLRSWRSPDRVTRKSLRKGSSIISSLHDAQRQPEDLSWRVEEACLNAFPAVRAILIEGWLIRLSGGLARRTNSVNPTRSCIEELQPMLREATALYTDAGRPLIVRSPSICAGLDRRLDAEGFSSPEAETCTLLAELAQTPSTPKTSADLEATPSPGWLTACRRLNGFDDEALSVYRQILGLIASPVQYAAARVDGEIVSIAYGAICRDLLVIESVATSPVHRGRGLAAGNVAALMSWAKGRGVAGSCLQVMAENLPARRLYERLGFTQELYRYHYRRREATADPAQDVSRSAP